MKGHLEFYQSIRILAVATIALLLVAISFEPVSSSANPPQGQSEIHHASPTPPPEVVEMEKMQKVREQIPKPGVGASEQQLVELIMKQPGGADIIRNAKAGTVSRQVRRAFTTIPPEVVERAKLKQLQQSIPKAGSKPTIQQLEESIMKQPGGVDMLKKAKEGRPPVSQNWQRISDWMAWMNPFSLKSAYAFQTPTQVLPTNISSPIHLEYKPTRPATMYGFNPNCFDLYCPNPSGQVIFSGSSIDYDRPTIGSVALYPSPRSILADGISVNNYAHQFQYLPKDGTYILSLYAYAYAGTNIKLWHRGSTGGYLHLRTFTTSSYGYVNLPHADYFTAGWHDFAWAATSGPGAMGGLWIFQINVQSYSQTPSVSITYKPMRPATMQNSNWNYFDLIRPCDKQQTQCDGGGALCSIYCETFGFNICSPASGTCISQNLVGEVRFNGAQITRDTPKINSVVVYPNAFKILVGGIAKYSFVSFTQNLPKDGYYIITLAGTIPTGNTVKLWHQGSTGSYMLLKTFNNPSPLAYLDRFSGGPHYFAWTIENANDGAIAINRVMVDSYPF